MIILQNQIFMDILWLKKSLKRTLTFFVIVINTVLYSSRMHFVHECTNIHNLLNNWFKTKIFEQKFRCNKVMNNFSSK